MYGSKSRKTDNDAKFAEVLRKSYISDKCTFCTEDSQFHVKCLGCENMN